MNVHRYMHVHKNQLKSPEQKMKSPPPKGKVTININKTNVATGTAGAAVAVRAPFGKVDTNHVSAMNHTNAKATTNKPTTSTTTTTTTTKFTTTTKPATSTNPTKKRRSGDAVRIDENGQVMKKRRSVGKSTPTSDTTTSTPTGTSSSSSTTTETPTGNITTELLDDALALLKQKLDATIPSTPTKDTNTPIKIKSPMPAPMPTPPTKSSTLSYLTSITTSMITRVADHVLDKVKDKVLGKKEEYVSLPVPAPAPEDEIIFSSINDETPASPTHDTSRFQKLLTRDTPRRRPRSSMLALLAPRHTSIDIENGMKAMSDVRCDVKKRKMGGNGGPLVDIDEEGDGKKSMLTRVTSFIHKPSTSSHPGIMSPVKLHLSHDDTIPPLPLSPSLPDEIQQAYDEEEAMDDGTYKFRHHYRCALEKQME